MRRLVLVGIVVLGLAGAGARADAGTRDTHTAAFYLQQATDGIARIDKQLWNAKAQWYNDTLDGQPPTTPLARLWSAYPLFETLVAIEKAQPTAANKAALTSFATSAAKLYWNPNAKPVGGYAYYPKVLWQGANIYYDDSGWWGVSFVDAYEATGNKAFLTDASRALRFIVASGWDRKNGGTWWDTAHHHKTIEPLAAAILIGTRLWEAQPRNTWALNWTKKLLAWADAHSFDRASGLYQRNATDKTTMDYAQGVMVEANWELCKALKQPALCTRAKQVANASYTHFGQDLDWSPQNDIVYLRWMLEYGKRSGDSRWLALATYNAQRAVNSVTDSGFYFNRWNGDYIADSLGEDAATLQLFALVAGFSS